MTSRKANEARFVGVAAWLFRKRWVAGLLSLCVCILFPGLGSNSLVAGSGEGVGSRGGGNFSPGSGGGGGHSRGSADNALESSGAFFQQLAGVQGQALQLPDRANVQQPLDRAGGGHFWWIHLSAMSASHPGPDCRFGKKPNGGAEAAAAKIQASEADAKARVAAVEYLGTVDCNRFPEAKKALLAALREDPNECVRFAAARSLNSGCCCDQEVIEKLKICVAGEKKGGPAETSCRVKAAAFSALQNCLMGVPEEVEAPQPRRAPPEGGEGLPEPIPDAKKRVKPEGTTMNTTDTSTITTSLKAANPRARTIEEESKTKPFAQTIKEARQTLFEAARYPQAAATLPPGKRTVYHALLKARKDIDGKSRPNPKDPSPGRNPGVATSTYGPAPASVPGQANLIPAQLPGSEPSASGESQQQTETENPQSSSPAKRGLFGLLLKQ